MKRFFFGGIHPRYNKEMSADSVDFKTLSPKQVAIPLHQHIGAPCVPLVSVGDRVLKGQKIGDGEGLCVPVHASVSGRVIAVEPRLHPNGTVVDAIVIENDGKEETVDFTGSDLPTSQLDGDTVLHTIREAGIVGMGGAAFPGDIKALSAMGKIDTLIANACECEPYITADDALLKTEPDHVLEGMMILAHLLSPQRVVLAIEDNKKIAIEKLRQLKSSYPAVEIVVLPTCYPQGGEKQLIQAVTKRQVPSGERPAAVGCVVYNVSTLATVYRAVRLGKPLTERLVTVSGETVTAPQNMLVPIGTSFRDIIETAGGLSDKTERVISGGPMMGVAQGDLDVPVVKATNAILCLPKDKNGKAETPVCIRCGKCLSVCPMHLQPLYLYRYTLTGDTKRLMRLNLFDCIECGSCSFTCPGKLPLAEKFREGKKLVKEAGEQ